MLGLESFDLDKILASCCHLCQLMKYTNKNASSGHLSVSTFYVRIIVIMVSLS